MSWTKYFADGTTISEPASWSRTRLDNIIAVELIHNGIRVALSGIGEYWQSDDFIFSATRNQSDIITRRIELKDPSTGQWKIYEITGNEKKHYLSKNRI